MPFMMKRINLMAADKAREVEALEWAEATLGDVTDATRHEVSVGATSMMMWR